MAYQYKGTSYEVEDDTQDEKRPLSPWNHKPFDPAKCGTNAGYKQHQNTGTKPCQPCKDGAAAYHRELRARRKAGLVQRVFESDKCGTLAGYSRHKRHNLPVCDDCRQARAEHRAQYYAREAA